eukprot:2671115-Pyramimonas_sp.AAC.1
MLHKFENGLCIDGQRDLFYASTTHVQYAFELSGANGPAWSSCGVTILARFQAACRCQRVR